MNYRTTYILKKILYSFLWLLGFVVIYILFKKYVDIDYLSWLNPIFDNTWVVYLIFLISEILIGIIPPEIFIIWALRTNILIDYLFTILLLAVFSYLSGILGYFIGYYLNRSVFFRFIKRRFLRKLYTRLQDFGLYLILIAALTPLPFSGVCMLVGSAGLPARRFILFSLSRFLRFFLYAYIFWQVDPDI